MSTIAGKDAADEGWPLAFVRGLVTQEWGQILGPDRQAHRGAGLPELAVEHGQCHRFAERYLPEMVGLLAWDRDHASAEQRIGTLIDAEKRRSL